VRVRAVIPAYALLLKLRAWGDRERRKDPDGKDLGSASRDAEDVVTLFEEVPSLRADIVAEKIQLEVRDALLHVMSQLAIKKHDWLDWLSLYGSTLPDTVMGRIAADLTFFTNLA
jgi:predicted nucleotidyltransferase